METIKRHKKYKAKSPTHTIKEIKDILKSKLDISLNETFFQDSKSMFHSCRINVANCNLGDCNIGTNGKGVTKDYALASAYGEFIERIQNNILIQHEWVARPKFINSYIHRGDYMKDNSLLLKYNIAPDEKYFNDHGQFSDTLSKLGFGDMASDTIPYLPFYDVFRNKVIYIPSLLISPKCSSNGMCAGNTPKEAIIQGICEIMERYAVRLIFERNLSLPSIPKEMFKGNLIYNYITELEESNNWTIEIKDCSCGIELPVIGMLIIDKAKTGYHFHLGADPSPITALERSITEIYQGRTDIGFHALDIAFMNDISKKTNLKDIEMTKIFYNSTGQFPLSVLSDNNSYKFTEWNKKYALSDDSDLLLLTELVKKLGFDMFVRDVSFLDFPAFRVYIPGMSETYYVFSSLPKVTPNSLFLIAHDLINATREDVDTLIEGLKSSNIGVSMLNFVNNSDFINRDYDLLMFILHFKNNYYSISYEYLSKYISRIQDNTFVYKCLRDIIYLKYIQRSEDNSCLYKFYNENMINELCEILDRGYFLRLFNLSSCFNCNECKIASSCKLVDIVRLSQRIECVFELHIPDQINNANYFYNLHQ